MEGKELDFSSLLLTRNVLTLQHRVRKRIPSGYICPPLPPRSPMSAVKLPPMPPPKPRRPLCKSLQQHPNLWVIRKQRTKFFSSKKKLESTCPAKSLCKFRQICSLPGASFLVSSQVSTEDKKAPADCRSEPDLPGGWDAVWTRTGGGGSHL